MTAVMLTVGGGGFLWTQGVFTKMKTAAAARATALGVDAGFRVNEIKVAGRNNVAQDVLLAKLGIAPGMPVFTADLQAAQESLSQLSWIKTARVSRRLPGTIVVEIEERHPAALWQHNKKVAVIDAEGVVLTYSNPGKYRDLPLVVGRDAGAQAMELIALLRAEDVIFSRLASAVRIGGRRWDIHLDNGIVVKLPEQDAGLALARLARLETRKHILDKGVAYIDLRLPDMFVVQPKQIEKKENI